MSCDNIATVLKRTLGRQIGFLLAAQAPALSAAIRAAIDLE